MKSVLLILISICLSSACANLAEPPPVLQIVGQTINVMESGEFVTSLLDPSSPDCDLMDHRIHQIDKQIEEMNRLLEKNGTLSPAQQNELHELTKRQLNLQALLTSPWARAEIHFSFLHPALCRRGSIFPRKLYLR